MYEILIYLVDDDYKGEVSDYSANCDFSLTIASGLEQAVKKCAEEWFDMVWIWPARYPNTAEFLMLLRQNNLNFLPVVALIDNREELQKLLALEITDYIILPAPRYEFQTIIQQIIEDLDVQSTVMEGMNWQASLEEYNLIDLIQTIDDSKNDAELILSYGGKNATVYFKEGKLVHAQIGDDLSGEFVLHKLVFWSKGNFQIRFSGQFSAPESIQSNNQEILLTLAHDLFEWDQFYRGMPELHAEMLVNPLIEPQNMSPIQKEILKQCRSPITIFNLFLIIKYENKIVIQEMKKLLDSNLIGKRPDIEKQIIEEKQRRGLSHFLNVFSSVFRKKQRLNEEQEPDKPLSREDHITQIKFNRFYLREEEKENIRNKIETLG